jgi:hypothetical protein
VAHWAILLLIDVTQPLGTAKAGLRRRAMR